MNFEIGKIINYYNKEGIILTEDGNKYLFLENDKYNRRKFRGR